MKLFLQICLVTIFIISCQPEVPFENHIFYLHGRILELQGRNAVSPQFGRYEFDAIIDSLESTGARVHYEIRTEEVDFTAFCQQTADQIDELVKSGVAPSNIHVIGASKGGVMAMYLSHISHHPINYILLGANNDQIEQENQWNLHGRVLGIYDRSDSLAGKNYRHWIDRSTNAIEVKDREINTGLGHGFLYRSINDWLEPAKDWMNIK